MALKSKSTSMGTNGRSNNKYYGRKQRNCLPN